MAIMNFKQNNFTMSCYLRVLSSLLELWQEESKEILASFEAIRTEIRFWFFIIYTFEEKMRYTYNNTVNM